MSESGIYLIHASASPEWVISRLQAKGIQTDQQPVRWLYLGRDYLRLLAWERSLGKGFVRVHYAKHLQELAMRWRRPYLDWIAALGLQNDNLVWWSSRVAERNTLLDSLYHKICYLQVALSSIQGDVPLLIVSESGALLRTIAAQSALRPRVQWIRKVRPLLEWLKWLLYLTFTWSRYLQDGIRAMRDARVTREGKPILPPATGRVRVLIHSCMDDTYFGADGCAHDRYFTVLPDELRRRGYDVVTVPWLYNLRRSRREAFSWFRQQSDRYLIPEDFYTLIDYIWAAWVVIRQAWLLPGLHVFEGRDITKLVREACLEQSLDTGVAKFARYFRLIHRWKRMGLKIDIFIDTFENMATEKPLVMALRKYMGNVVTVGFQHYVAPYPLWLCGFSTRTEGATAPHPDVVVCNSPWTANLFAKEGFPPEKLRIGPSLRYLYMMDGQVDRQAQVEPESRTVLVPLPLETTMVTELMYKLLEAFPLHENTRFWLKPHPMMSTEEWMVLLDGNELPGHMEKVGGSMADWLPRATCAVAMASTTALEIALAGVPVVLVGRETDFDLNPLAWFPEFDNPVHSPEELRARVLRKLSLSPAERERLKDWARLMLRECLSPLNEETLSAFVRTRRIK